MKKQQYTKSQLITLETYVKEFNDKKICESSLLCDMGIIIGLQIDKKCIYDYNYETDKYEKIDK